jgi:methionine biosynthesis protein MetW
MAEPQWKERLAALLAERAERYGSGPSDEALNRLVDLLEISANAEPQKLVDHFSISRNGERRWDHDLISKHIPDGASVMDLGCGDGSLLKRLMATKGVHAQGIEIDFESVLNAVENGVPVFQANLDAGLAGFPGGSFDYVVLEETIQTLNRPRTVLREMVRVGNLGIVTFPNFGYWKVRLDIALNGRMPITETLPYAWFETPNIRLLTLNDFRTWAADECIEIVEGHTYAEGEVRRLEEDDNLFADEVMVVIRRNRDG